jgi:hypothetical protein
VENPKLIMEFQGLSATFAAKIKPGMQPVQSGLKGCIPKEL